MSNKIASTRTPPEEVPDCVLYTALDFGPKTEEPLKVNGIDKQETDVTVQLHEARDKLAQLGELMDKHAKHEKKRKPSVADLPMLPGAIPSNDKKLPRPPRTSGSTLQSHLESSGSSSLARERVLNTPLGDVLQWERSYDIIVSTADTTEGMTIATDKTLALLHHQFLAIALGRTNPSKITKGYASYIDDHLKRVGTACPICMFFQRIVGARYDALVSKGDIKPMKNFNNVSAKVLEEHCTMPPALYTPYVCYVTLELRYTRKALGDFPDNPLYHLASSSVPKKLSLDDAGLKQRLQLETVSTWLPKYLDTSERPIPGHTAIYKQLLHLQQGGNFSTIRKVNEPKFPESLVIDRYDGAIKKKGVLMARQGDTCIPHSVNGLSYANRTFSFPEHDDTPAFVNRFSPMSGLCGDNMQIPLIPNSVESMEIGPLMHTEDFNETPGAFVLCAAPDFCEIETVGGAYTRPLNQKCAFWKIVNDPSGIGKLIDISTQILNLTFRGSVSTDATCSATHALVRQYNQDYLQAEISALNRFRVHSITGMFFAVRSFSVYAFTSNKPTVCIDTSNLSTVLISKGLSHLVVLNRWNVYMSKAFNIPIVKYTNSRKAEGLCVDLCSHIITSQCLSKANGTRELSPDVALRLLALYVGFNKMTSITEQQRGDLLREISNIDCGMQLNGTIKFGFNQGSFLPSACTASPMCSYLLNALHVRDAVPAYTLLRCNRDVSQALLSSACMNGDYTWIHTQFQNFVRGLSEKFEMHVFPSGLRNSSVILPRTMSVPSADPTAREVSSRFCNFVISAGSSELRNLLSMHDITVSSTIDDISAIFINNFDVLPTHSKSISASIHTYVEKSVTSTRKTIRYKKGKYTLTKGLDWNTSIVKKLCTSTFTADVDSFVEAYCPFESTIKDYCDLQSEMSIDFVALLALADNLPFPPSADIDSFLVESSIQIDGIAITFRRLLDLAICLSAGDNVGIKLLLQNMDSWEEIATRRHSATMFKAPAAQTKALSYMKSLLMQLVRICPKTCAYFRNFVDRIPVIYTDNELIKSLSGSFIEMLQSVGAYALLSTAPPNEDVLAAIFAVKLAS